MAQAIRSYMNEEITAFEFDDALDAARSETEDSTVVRVRRALWFFYDDCKDHKIVASKEVWDYLNRLLLLLESDAELETIRAWREWHALQGVAAALFLTFLVIAVRVGWGEHLLAYALPFGPPSMLLAWLNSRRQRKQVSRLGVALTPFPSVGSLRAVRCSVRGFVRRRYPGAIARRRIRDPIVGTLWWVYWSVLWCMFSPVALFAQMLPERKSETRIRMPECPAGPDAPPHAARP